MGRKISTLEVDSSLDVTGATVAGLDSALDAASTRPVTNALLTSTFADLPAAFVASATYAADDLISEAGNLYRRVSAGTSAGSFASDSANWVVVDGVNQLPEDWASGISYAEDDQVAQSGKIYVSTASHTSAALFSTDLAAGVWVELSQFVLRPTVTVDETLARFDGTTGKVQSSSASLSDAGALSVTSISSGAVSLTSALTTSETCQSTEYASTRSHQIGRLLLLT